MGFILMVDDEKDLQLLVNQRFRKQIKEGTFNFIFAHNGLEALEILETQKDVDVIVTDIHMPGMDGLMLLDKIPLYSPRARSIVLSAYDDIQNLRKAMNHGAFDFITKPLNFGELEEILIKSLKQKSRYILSSPDKKPPLSFEEESFLKIFRQDFSQEKMPLLASLNLETLLFSREDGGSVLYDSFLLGEGLAFFIMISHHASLVSMLSLMKAREVLRSFSLAFSNEPDIWIKNFKTYQKAFLPEDFSIASCWIDKAGTSLKACCFPNKQFFLESDDFSYKKNFQGRYAILSKGLTISFQDPVKKEKTPLVSLRPPSSVH